MKIQLSLIIYTIASDNSLEARLIGREALMGSSCGQEILWLDLAGDLNLRLAQTHFDGSVMNIVAASCSLTVERKGLSYKEYPQQVLSSPLMVIPFIWKYLMCRFSTIFIQIIAIMYYPNCTNRYEKLQTRISFKKFIFSDFQIHDLINTGI